MCFSRVLLLLFVVFLPYSPHCFGVSELPDIKTIEDERNVKEIEELKKKNQRGNIGKDIKHFGEEVAFRIDRIIQRKAFELWSDPWTLQGIPLIFPGASNGFHLGLRVALQNIERQDPHKMQIETQLLASDLGRYKHMLSIDYPHLYDDMFHLYARVSYDRDVNLRYFGIGNETTVDYTLLDQDSVLYRSIRAVPSVYVSALRRFGKNLQIGPFVGLKWVQVVVPAGSLLDRDSPQGIGGGKTHFFGLAIVWDALDFEPYPSSGYNHELYLSLYNGLTGSEYNFFRGTYTFRKYIPLNRKLVLAYRVLFESLSGDIPFYELCAVGGSDSTIGLGADRFFRGYESNRFIDKIRLISGIELRWDPIRFDFAGQDITLGFVPFVDVGRVWPSVFPVRLGTWHASTGWGMRIIWNNRFVIRGDFAVNADRTAFFMELGNSF